MTFDQSRSMGRPNIVDFDFRFLELRFELKFLISALDVIATRVTDLLGLFK